jgi:hypothetical protein
VRRLTLAWLVAALCGCGSDSSGPEPTPFSVTLTAPPDVGGIRFTEGGVARLRCSVAYMASVTGGSKGASGHWLSAHLEYRSPSGTLLAAFDETAVHMADFWGSDRFKTGDVLNAGTWNFASAATGFRIIYTFRYSGPDGALNSVTAITNCNAP